MRSIPQDLLKKLLNHRQVKSTDAAPKLHLVVSQATINTLMSEPIHEDITPAFGDVALRQLPGETTPSLAYAICIDSGTANLYKRTFPADWEKPWEYLWSLGQAKDVAIEFDGIWVLEPKKRWHVLETEMPPYIFWIGMDNNLYVQKWQDETSRLLLAENVTQISVCRGWQSADIPDQDQGLVIAYLRGGCIYYRAFCTQFTGEDIWEEERSIIQFANVASLSVFRTNDFRLGLIAEINGEIHWLLSKRTYAGQSVRPESFYTQMGTANLAYLPINYINRNTEAGYLSTFNDMYEGGIIYFPANSPAFQALSLERVDNNKFIATFNYPLTPRKNLTPDLFSITSPYAISNITIMDDTKLVITTETNIARSVPITVNFIGNWQGNLRYEILPTAMQLVPALSMVFPNEPINAFDYGPTFTATLLMSSLQYKKITYSFRYGSMGSICGNLASVTLVATQVGPVPI